MKNKLNYLFIVCPLLLIFWGCTDLEELPLDGELPKTEGSAGASDLLNVKKELAKLYNGQDKLNYLNELSSDELAIPTRGGDWDDNATLRQLHTHTWSADHTNIKNTYNDILTGIFNCDLVLADAAQSADHAKVKFVKGLLYFYMVDMFGQVPYRTSLSDLTVNPEVYDRTAATNFAIQLLEDALPTLPDKTVDDASIISKDAANFLLAKFYLNKAVYTSAPSGTSPTFDAADMEKVVTHVAALTSTLNAVDATGKTYWDNFSPTNNTSNEIVFSIKNVRNDKTFGENRWMWRMGQHYNMYPDGWNGAAIVGEFYAKFQENGVTEGSDKRATYSATYDTNKVLPIGVLRGQQLKPDGSKVSDRQGRDLVLTELTQLVLTDPTTLESAGYRPMKYIPDTESLDTPENDFVIFRYSDALLMAAEAMERGATTQALNGRNKQQLLDDVRARVGLASIPFSLDNLLAERGRELWLEFWRRNDLIRFGKFLDARQLKPGVSDVKYLLFSIPADALINPNITQNPGY